MFGKMVRALQEGHNAAKATKVLLMTYGLSLDASGHQRMKSLLKYGLADQYNEHSLAIQFLADFAQDGLHPCDPSAQTTLTNFIRKAKGAKNRGLLSGDRPLQELYQVARDRFGIDPDKIDAV
jgi:hypothetical protein